jgi:hypothetical protein
VNEVKRPGAKLRAIVWITHSDEQALRVATRFLKLTPGGIVEETSISPSRVSILNGQNGDGSRLSPSRISIRSGSGSRSSLSSAHTPANSA